MYTSIVEDTKEVLLNLFYVSTNLPVIEIAEMCKQRGAKECGLYAITIATKILFDVSNIQFHEQKMRTHLLKCYQNKVITPFPA